jgi:asparagine synthase (glutamine-hydrolysing)
MDGDGVDEGLAGYASFLPFYLADVYIKNKEKMPQVANSYGFNKDKAIEVVSKVIDGHYGSAIGQDSSKSAYKECLNSDFLNQHKDRGVYFDVPFDSYLKNQMYKELMYTKIPRALRFKDRVGMANSVELRPAFLNHNLLEYMFSLSNNSLIGNKQQKYILRKQASSILPKGIYDANKKSVQSPNREWFRGKMKGWVYDMVNQQSFWDRGWVDKKTAMVQLDSFMSGDGDNAFFIWQWINLEIWAKQKLD